MGSDHPTHPDSLVARLAKLPRDARERIRTAAMMTEATASAAITRKDRTMNAEDDAQAIIDRFPNLGVLDREELDRLKDAIAEAIRRAFSDGYYD